MNYEEKQKLFEKNSRIIEAVKQRAERICPGALDMIAVTGSFATGDFHEKSDLDLLIVIGNEEGYALSHCFILEDVGYDLYCHTWERLEDAANYDSPYVSKLLDAQIVYSRCDAVLTRFAALGKQLRAHLATPLTQSDIAHAQACIAMAKQSYFDLAACGGEGYHFPLYGIIYCLENAVYLLNHAVVSHGVRGICAEIRGMQMLPADFSELHDAMFGDVSYDAAMADAMNMIRNTERLIAEMREVLFPRADAAEENLRGCYEELISNYYNKLVLAKANNDRYLSCMTLTSSALFFRDIADTVALGADLSYDNASYADSASALCAFRQAMGALENIYASVGMSVCRYADISAFENEYIPPKQNNI